jgi:hypothetical protein
MKTKLNYRVVVFLLILTAALSPASIKAQRAQKVFKGANLTFNGTPFFPLGVYNVCKDIQTDSLNNSELDLLKNAGFNLISQYNVPTGDPVAVNRFRSFMDRCNSRGIFILANGPTKNRSTVDAYHLHPALFAYAIGDDANDGRLPPAAAKTLDNTFKEWDSTAHFTYIANLPHYNEALEPGSDYFTSCDIIGLEMYPIDSWAENTNTNPFNPFTKEDELLQNEIDCSALQLSNKENRPWLEIPQAFTWANYSEGNDGRKSAKLPTPDELRNIVYVGFINGAKGLIYYEFHNPGRVRNKVESPGYKLYATDSLWNEVKSVNAEVKTLQKVYMFGHRTKIQANPWTSAAYWIYEGSTYVIVANLNRTQAQPFSCAINVAGKLTNVFHNRKESLFYTDGKLSGNIPARQVQVYKIN